MENKTAGCPLCTGSGGCGKTNAAVPDYADGTLLKAAVHAYVLPLILLFVGAIVGIQIGGNDVSAALGAAMGLCCGFVLLRVISKNFS